MENKQKSFRLDGSDSVVGFVVATAFVVLGVVFWAPKPNLAAAKEMVSTQSSTVMERVLSRPCSDCGQSEADTSW